jgi:hypothetical protein
VTFDPADNDTTPSMFVGALPEGEGYTATVSATAEGTTCTPGSSTFEIEANLTTDVTVQLECAGAGSARPPRGNAVINGEITVVPGETCPYLTSVVISPVQTTVDGVIDISATTSLAGTDVVWASDGGTFNAAETEFTCTVAGEHTITATIPATDTCSADVITATINCIGDPVCGNGAVETGEECDPPAAGTCDSECQLIDSGTGGTTGTGGTGTGGATGGTESGGTTATGGTESGGTTATGGTESGGTTATGGTESGGTTATGGTGTGGGGNECPDCLSSKCAGTQADQAARCADGSCDAYLACIATSNCDDALNENGQPDMRICYCGTLSLDQCFSDETDPSQPDGPCKTLLEPLLRTTLPLTIGTRFFNPAEQGGAIHQNILCRQRDCSGVCET